MNNALSHILLAVVALLSLSACRQGDTHVVSVPTQELKELNEVIKSAPQYRIRKQQAIEQLKRRLHAAPTTQAQWQLSLALCNTFRQVNSDSALAYANRCLSLAQSMPADSLRLLESRMAVVRSLATAGLFIDALDIFQKVHYPSLTTDAQKTVYWSTGRLMYGYMTSYVKGLTVYSDRYGRRYNACDDSLMHYLPHDDMRLFIESERLVASGDYISARPKLESLLTRVKEDENLYGMAAYQMAIVCRNTGYESDYARWLAEAAMSDIRGCVREGIALPNLAEWLYMRGQLGDAFGYINFALDDAMRGNARMRMVYISKMVPMIDEAYRKDISSNRDRLMIFSILAATMCLISVGLVVVLVVQRAKSKEKSRKLRTLSRLQDTYIGNFIGMCSAYAERLDSLTRTVSRKLSQGQSDELLRLVNSGKFADAQYDSFYAIFDSAFLDLYPDFIEGLNLLLRPEEQLDLTEFHGRLTPEMRIYALVRLGVEESTKIANVLHYSVNTVYTYRNRMRNRAINRDTFDADIRSINN